MLHPAIACRAGSVAASTKTWILRLPSFPRRSMATRRSKQKQPKANRMKEKEISFEVFVHSVPKDLQFPLDNESRHLTDTAELYQFCVSSRLIWRVWQIDRYNKLWIAINRMGNEGAEYHTLALDEGTYEKVESDPYRTLFEEPF